MRATAEGHRRGLIHEDLVFCSGSMRWRSVYEDRHLANSVKRPAKPLNRYLSEVISSPLRSSRAKFHKITCNLLLDAQVDELEVAIWDLERVSEVGTLLRLAAIPEF